MVASPGAVTRAAPGFFHGTRVHGSGIMDERQLVLAAQSGDTSALGELCQMHSGFIIQAARKFESRWIDVDDLIQVGFMSLMDSVRSFRLSAGVKLLTYSGRGIFHSMRREAQKARGDFVSLDTGVPVADQVATAEDNDDVEQLREIAKSLPNQMCQVILWRMEGLTLEEIGQRFGITKERVRQIESRAKAAIREAMER